MKHVWILQKTNYYRGTSVSLHGFTLTLKAGKIAFDNQHQHEVWCDYCRTKWRRTEDGGAVRAVDHDDAFVEYEVLKIELVK